MRLNTLHHIGRRVSYQALVRVTIADEGQSRDTAYVCDETGLWTATVQLDARLSHRMGDDIIAFFWARFRGGDIDLRDREIDPEWEDGDGP